MSKKINNKKIPTKNYIIVGAIFALSFILIILGAKWYKNYQEYQLTIPVISGHINEVSNNEIDNYLLENNDTIIYVGTSDDSNCRALETDLKDFIKKHNLRDKMVYLNLSKIDNKDYFIKQFNKKYASNKKIDQYPAIIIIKGGKILDIASKSNNQKLSIDDIEQLLEENEVLGD